MLLSAPVALGGPHWAFIASTGDAVAIQDVATGTVAKRIATGDPVEAGMVAATGDGASRLILVYGGVATSYYSLSACPAGMTP